MRSGDAVLPPITPFSVNATETVSAGGGRQTTVTPVATQTKPQRT
jgi:hypothetical protein